MAGLADVAELIVLLKLKDEISKPLKNLDKGITQSMRNSQSASYKIGAGIGQSIKNVAKIGVAGAAAVATFSVAGVKWAADLEAQLNTINTVANVTPEQLKGIGLELRKVARDTGLSLDELTASYYDLVSAGIKVGDAQSVLNNAVTLGIGGLATTQETVDLLTTAYNTYGLDAAGATKATDMFAQAIADGKVKADAIAASFANVAPIAKASGIGIDQIAASYAYLTAQGVPASEVATEMNRAIISLLSPTNELAAAGKRLGVNWETEIRKKGLVPTLQEIRDYSDKTHIPLIDLVGRIEAVKYILQTTGPEAAGFAAELDKIRKASGVAAAQAGEREQGLAFQFGRLKAIVRDAGITIGTHLLPPLADVAEKLGAFIEGHQGDLDNFGKRLAEMFSPQNISGALAFVDKVIPGIIAGLQLAGDVAKTTVGIFQSLPTEVKGLLVGALAIHKLSGGLLTGGLIQAAGGPLGQLLGNTPLAKFFDRGSPANPMYVVPLGGGLGGGPQDLLPKVAGGAGLLTAAGAVTSILAMGALATGVGIDQNNQLKDKYGLTQDEIRAYKWSQMSEEDRANSRRHGYDRPPDYATLLADAFRKINGTSGAGGANSGSGGGDTRSEGAGIRIAGQQLGHSGRWLRMLTNPDIGSLTKSVLGGRGNVEFTERTIARLKAAEAAAIKSGDRGLAASIHRDLVKVEAKLAHRKFVEGQFHKVTQIAKSSETTKEKIADLTSIQRRFQARGDTHSAAIVAARIQALKQTVRGGNSDTRSELRHVQMATQKTTAAARATTQAVKDKDLSVTLRADFTTNISVSAMQQAVSRQARLTKIINGSQQMGGV